MSASWTRVFPVVLTCVLIGCKGGSLDTGALPQAADYDVERKAVPSIQAPAGFRAVQIAEGLNFPSSMTWDRDGRL